MFWLKYCHGTNNNIKRTPTSQLCCEMMTLQILMLIALAQLQTVAVSGLQCYSCLDVNILETERENITNNPLYDSLVEFVFGGVPPSDCDSPSLVTCLAGETCFSLQTITEGTFRGIRGKADVLLSRCIDLSVPGYEKIPHNGCVENDKGYDLDEWEGYLDAATTSMTGVTCTCSEDACNDPTDYQGLFCYTCIDVDILETDRVPNSTIKSLYDTEVDFLFKGIAPSSCDLPTVNKCSETETTCFTAHAIMLGTYYDIRGKASVKAAKCQDLTDPGFGLISQTGCLPNSKAWDLSEWQQYVDFTFEHDVTGIECTCDETVCNEPKDFDVKQCSTCKDVEASFGDMAVNQRLMSRLLLELFDMNAPWCPYPGDVVCKAGGLCTTIILTIHGQYDGQIGSVKITQHRCISALELLEYRINLTRDCESVTSALLIKLYGEAINRPFSSVDKVDGTLCTCNTDMCNLPERQSVKPNQNSSTKSQMTFTTLVLVMCAIYM